MNFPSLSILPTVPIPYILLLSLKYIFTTPKTCFELLCWLAFDSSETLSFNINPAAHNQILQTQDQKVNETLKDRLPWMHNQWWCSSPKQINCFELHNIALHLFDRALRLHCIYLALPEIIPTIINFSFPSRRKNTSLFLPPFL